MCQLPRPGLEPPLIRHLELPRRHCRVAIGRQPLVDRDVPICQSTGAIGLLAAPSRVGQQADGERGMRDGRRQRPSRGRDKVTGLWSEIAAVSSVSLEMLRAVKNGGAASAGVQRPLASGLGALGMSASMQASEGGSISAPQINHAGSPASLVEASRRQFVGQFPMPTMPSDAG